MCIVCEGCGLRIYKQDQIRHESIECRNPLAKCHFCSNIFSLSEMSAHMRECSQRAVVKVEYVNDPEAAAYNNTNLKLLDFDARPDQEYKPNQVSGESSGTKGKGTSNNKKGSNSSKNLSSINRSALSKSPEKETKGNKTKKEKKQFFDMMMQMQDAMQL